MENSNRNFYNVIYAGGNIPPMMASLMSIANGYPTYVFTDRGRSFSGIDSVKNFYNIGYDITKVQSLDEEYPLTATKNKIAEIKANDPLAYFYIYTGESRGLKCAAIAANAGLTKTDFHIYMLEDGIDSYKKFDLYYGSKAFTQCFYDILFAVTKRIWFSSKAAELISGKITDVSKGKNPMTAFLRRKINNAPGKRFEKMQKKVYELFEKIMSNCSNHYDGLHDYKYSFPLAVNSNFTYVLQDKTKVDGIVKNTNNKKLWEIFDISGNGRNSTLNMTYKSIPDMVNALTERQKKDYITLIIGDNKSLDVLKRQNRADEKAPDKKLIYINSRFHTLFTKPVTDPVYGIGGAGGNDMKDMSYSALPEKYKSTFLFAQEEDYSVFADRMALMAKTPGLPAETAARTAAKAFNIYADYIFTIKFIYKLYGGSYDLIIKNHPRCDFGNFKEWGGYYLVKYGDNKVLDWGEYLNLALVNFHKYDSIGRYVAYIDGSISTECLEYLDSSKVSFRGQPSSVYNGLSDRADIPFIITDSDYPISGGGDSQVAYSAVPGRYNAGKMNFTDEEGNLQTTVYYNTGNILKYCREICIAEKDENLADFYNSLFKKWINKTDSKAVNTDKQGFIVY